MKTKIVEDLGQGKILEQVEEEAKDQEKDIGEYNVRLDKETHNFFKTQERIAQNSMDRQNRRGKKLLKGQKDGPQTYK